MVNKPKKNHYVPRFYLKQWSNNGNTIYVRKNLVPHNGYKQWCSKQIRSLARIDDFYTLYDSNDKEICDLEDFFNSTYETPAAPVFKKVYENRIIDRGEIDILVNYLYAQYFRTPSMFEELAKIFPEVFQEHVAETIKRFSDNNNPFPDKSLLQQSETKHHLWNSVYPDRKVKPGMVGKFTRALYIETIDSLLKNNNYLNDLKKQEWRIYRVDEDILLPTSDKPVYLCFLNDKGNLICNANCGLYMLKTILNPKSFIFTQIGNSKKRLDSFTPNRNFYMAIKDLIIRESRLYIYSKEKIANIESIRKRQVDPNLYSLYKKNLLNWDTIQKNFERSTDVDPDTLFFI